MNVTGLTTGYTSSMSTQQEGEARHRRSADQLAAGQAELEAGRSEGLNHVGGRLFSPEVKTASEEAAYSILTMR